ncbi:LacI family DNA-binding transcriptional regulator [Actinomycetospora termitidis]|uniref:LacI family DNA-binding transcriptional regulator n=1 Tax=Actinomycetospora termitidis TaxID=3053470 RepID=A0ABT7MI15_9PSEU|nr:LacI family DNA-binding transcriptional regulator [Actinomycetospora sp. Odt1-22]MDL5160291.1 LacI family DNA-binding transcriptional regulator [Actinomycetospora sp. Odt1-22]
MTLATVAAELGVSRATVSNAYNHPERLSARLRSRILSTAGELGYAGPDPLAATLARGRVAALGVVIGEPVTFAFSDPAAAQFMEGISELCEREGLALVLVPGRRSAAARVALVDGVICYCDFPDDRTFGVIRERGLPFVIVDGPPFDGAGHVGIDDEAGAYAAARHLLDLGHTRLGIVPMPLHGDGWEGAPSGERQVDIHYHATRRRLAGYRRAVEEAGLRWEGMAVEERAPYGREAGRRAAAALLARRPRPTALLAMSDELAFGALDAAEALGLAVPGDLSLVGFDDVPAAATGRPPLTTVRQPHREKGRRAAEMVLRPNLPVEPLVLPADLVVRGSTGPRSRDA